MAMIHVAVDGVLQDEIQENSDRNRGSKTENGSQTPKSKYSLELLDPSTHKATCAHVPFAAAVMPALLTPQQYETSAKQRHQVAESRVSGL